MIQDVLSDHIWMVLYNPLLQVTRADYLSGRTALHFAAVNGHVRCMRLVVADFVPSAPYESLNAQTVSDRSDSSGTRTKFDKRFVFCSRQFDLFYTS